MRRIVRETLDPSVQEHLDQRQAEVNRKRQENTLQIGDEWQSARQTRPLQSVLATLRHMMGDRERCMYCLDSHGTDIEHFWPKAPYPERMFIWPNLLLCCAECGRFKGDRFPLFDGEALLVDPTAEEPWLYLDFDPATGNVVARFDAAHDDWSRKGQVTVETLQLDRREALAVGYQRTYRRLVAVVRDFLNNESPSGESLLASLREADDHGLSGWCFIGTGQSLPPFADLRMRCPEVWAICVESIAMRQRGDLP